MESEGRKEENLQEMEEILNTIPVKIPVWKTLQKTDISIKRMGYGLSRTTYKLIVEKESREMLGNGCPSVLMYRILRAKNPNSLIEIEDENLLFSKTAEFGIGPKLISCDSHYRVEEYLDSRIIKCEEINQVDLRRKLAMKLAFFHQIDLKIDKKPFLDQVFQNDFFLTRFQENCSLKNCYTEEQNHIIGKIKNLMDLDTLNFINKFISQENYTYVLSHNDIWMGNILINEESRDVFLIDYERVAYNFAGYDIAKLLLEPLYKRIHENSPEYLFVEENLPSETDILDFLRFYNLGRTDKLTLDQKKQVMGDVLKEGDFFEGKVYQSSSEKEKILGKMLKETYFGMMVCGFFMSILGMYVGNTKEYGLDFIQFGLDGYSIYDKFKKKYFE